jgi:hypothetical protein
MRVAAGFLAFVDPLFLLHGLLGLSVGTTLEGNTDFSFKRRLLTRGRARFKHGGDVDVEFLST